MNSEIFGVFVSAATGVAAVAVLFKAFAGKTTEKLGNTSFSLLRRLRASYCPYL